MKLKNLDRQPTAYEVIPQIQDSKAISVDARGTVNVPAFARLNIAEAKEVAMALLFAAALADLEGNLPPTAHAVRLSSSEVG
jgi:hypothetical protein